MSGGKRLLPLLAMPSLCGQEQLYHERRGLVRIACVLFLMVLILCFWLGSVRRETSLSVHV